MSINQSNKFKDIKREINEILKFDTGCFYQPNLGRRQKKINPSDCWGWFVSQTPTEVVNIEINLF